MVVCKEHFCFGSNIINVACVYSAWSRIKYVSLSLRAMPLCMKETNLISSQAVAGF